MIDQGRCVYFGPTDRAKSYFEDLGFVCPPRQTTADFLSAVTDPNVRIIRQDYKTIVPRSPEDLQRAFQNSRHAKSNLKEIASFEKRIQETNSEAHEIHVKKGKRSVYTISFLEQVKACAYRQFQILWGDKKSLIAKNFLTVFQGVIIGSLFFNMPATSNGVFTRGGVLLYYLLFRRLI